MRAPVRGSWTWLPNSSQRAPPPSTKSDRPRTSQPRGGGPCSPAEPLATRTEVAAARTLAVNWNRRCCGLLATMIQFCASHIAQSSIEFRIHQEVAPLRADKDGERVNHCKNRDHRHSGLNINDRRCSMRPEIFQCRCFKSPKLRAQCAVGFVSRADELAQGGIHPPTSAED